MPADENTDPFTLARSMFRDWFRDSLEGQGPPPGYQEWGYKLVRSDRSAGGGLSWPARGEVLVETGLSDGYRGGVTPPGLLAVARDVAGVAATSAVGGSVLLTVAFNTGDVAGQEVDGVVLVRRAFVADADLAAMNLSSGIFSDARYRPFDTVDVGGLHAAERASFLGPEPLQPPGLDTRPRTTARPGGSGDWLAVAAAVYRQPPNDPAVLAAALAQLTGDEAARQRLAQLQVHASVLQHALPWDRQVAVQRRVDGYLLEHFGRTDPGREDPARPMSRAEQWLHTLFAAEFLNLAETLIEYDAGFDDLAADPLALLQRLLPAPAGRRELPSPLLMPGPAYLILNLSGDDGKPQ
jgi:hypothetical protein